MWLWVGVVAGEEDGGGVGLTGAEPVATGGQGTRYGLFDWLDHRSTYGEGAFPEPFLVDDTNLESDEFRLDYLHTRGCGRRDEWAKAELEKGYGLLTMELEVPYEKSTVGGRTEQGIGNLGLGVRHPLYQWVSDDEWVNTTVGVGVEFGIPSGSPVGRNGELACRIFNDLSLGRHFTLQSVLGFSHLYGAGEDGGLQTFEYGLVFGYAVSHRELPVPGIRQLVPVLELKGETALNKEAAGGNSLLGNLAVRANLDPIGEIQPRIGLGYVFAIDHGARRDLSCGIMTSLVFEY